MTKNNIVAIIQARTGSTRLPRKVLMDIVGKSMLWHVLERVKKSKMLDSIVVATTNKDGDKDLIELAKRSNVGIFTGSEEDVLDRYYQAAKRFKANIIVRITSDCPLIDPKIVDIVIKKHLDSEADYTTNSLERTFPRGLDVEVFNFEILKQIQEEAKEYYQREHVTPYIREHPEVFRLVNIENNEDLSNMRWTVDEVKDLELVREIYKRLYKKGEIFLMKDITNLLKRYPELMEINKNVKQKKQKEI